MSASALLECESAIDLLPEEMMCLIFDHLDLTSVKSASLTCRKWHDIIFLSYIDRFKFQIRLPIIERTTIHPFQQTSRVVVVETQQFPNDCDKFMENVIESVKHTKRCYRNVDITVNEYTASYFLPLWECMLPKVAKNILTLKLTIQIPCFMLLVPIITNGLKLMQKLRSLSLLHCGLTGQDSVLRNSFVTHLEVMTTCDVSYTEGITVDMPELVSFKGPLSVLSCPVNITQPLVFAKLKHVTFTHDSCATSDPSIIHRMPHVETVNLHFCIGDKLFIAMCDTFKSLKTLHLHQFTDFTDRATIRNISKLVNLRRLKLYGIDTDRRLDLSALTKLEHLNLIHVDLDNVNLNQLPRSITELSVYMGVEFEEYAANFKQLRKLYIKYIYPNTAVANHTLKSIQHLEHLEVLAFKYAKFGESSFLDLEVPLHRVRTLVLVDCDRSDNQRLHETFPNVKQITFISEYTFD